MFKDEDGDEEEDDDDDDEQFRPSFVSSTTMGQSAIMLFEYRQ